VRGRSRVKRVGHTGTLDPAATGVLPVCLGQATRLAEYLTDADKTYVADVELGVETDTYDADGAVVARADATGITLAAIEDALRQFEGEFDQTPPMYSAIKRQGVPMYKLARAGETIDLPARRVRVDALRLVSYEAPGLRIEIDCAKGFYVRSLAHDLGQALGVGGSLSALQRTRVGSFGIDQAVDMETLKGELTEGTWQKRLWAPDEVLNHWQALILGSENETRLRTGRSVSVEELRAADSRGLCRAYGLDGSFLAVVRREGEGTWGPEKVFSAAGSSI
jgi:tRNA pseudouridine55 synthase